MEKLTSDQKIELMKIAANSGNSLDALKEVYNMMVTLITPQKEGQEIPAEQKEDVVTLKSLNEGLKFNRIMMFEILGYVSSMLYEQSVFETTPSESLSFEMVYAHLFKNSGLDRSQIDKLFKGLDTDCFSRIKADKEELLKGGCTESDVDYLTEVMKFGVWNPLYNFIDEIPEK